METLTTISPIFLNIIVSLVSFGAGYSTHWFITRRHKGEDLRKDTRTIITFVVLIVWAISVVIDMVSVEYSTPFAIHGIFGAIVGFFYETNLKDLIKK